jgi:hypothetical protein
MAAQKMTGSGRRSQVRGAVEEALRRSASRARREYVRAGLSMPVWRSGRLVWVKPTELKRYEADGHAATLGHEGTKGKGAV